VTSFTEVLSFIQEIAGRTDLQINSRTHADNRTSLCLRGKNPGILGFLITVYALLSTRVVLHRTTFKCVVVHCILL